MGVLNRIMLIFILLAAAGAAVLSYFLFEKRTDLMKGWDLMATQINTTAKNLDKGSGTDVEKQIDTKGFSHRNLRDMETKLKNLSSGAEKVVKQRDELAQAITDITNEVGVTADKTALLNVTTYLDHCLKLQRDLNEYKRKNDKIAENFALVGSKAKITITADDIKDAKKDQGAGHADTVNTKLAELEENNKKLQANLDQLASVVGVRIENAEKFNDALKEAQRKLADQNNKLDSANKEIDSNKKQIEREIAKWKRLDLQNQKLEKDILKKNTEISILRKKINPTNNANINRMIYVEKDREYYLSLYSLVRNQVKRVDTQWNFVTLDIGRKRQVQQTFAGRTFKTDLDIPSGRTMTVVRGLDGKKPQIIGKVILRDVHADYAIADIVLNSLRDRIQEGDAVVFLEDDLKYFMNDIEKLLRKKK